MTPERKKELEYIVDYEVIVDCYDDWEVETGWEIYLSEKMDYPFKAEAEIKKKGKKAEIKNIEVTDFVGLYLNQGVFYLEVNFIDDENLFQISSTQIINIHASKKTKEVFEVWNFWNKKI
jgi:hypothetical protein